LTIKVSKKAWHYQMFRSIYENPPTAVNIIKYLLGIALSILGFFLLAILGLLCVLLYFKEQIEKTTIVRFCQRAVLQSKIISSRIVPMLVFVD
jgi:RNase P/RNase MRP subunit POP5